MGRAAFELGRMGRANRVRDHDAVALEREGALGRVVAPTTQRDHVGGVVHGFSLRAGVARVKRELRYIYVRDSW